MADSSESSSSFSSIRSVTRGASVFFVGTGVNNVQRFLINLLLTRTLGTSLYGVYTYGTTLLSVVSVFTNLGTNQSLLRFIPEYEDDLANQNRIIGLASLTTLVASIVAAAVAFVAAPVITDLTLDNPMLTDVIRLFAIALPFRELGETIGRVFQSIEMQGHQMLTTSVGLQAFRLAAIAVAIALGAAFIGIIAAMVVAWVLAFGFGLALLFSRTSFRPTFGKSSKDELIEFYDFSLPLTLGHAGSVLQSRVDILMVGFFLSGSAVGIYNVASVLSRFLRMPLTGFSKLFPPIASGLYARGEIAELESVYSQITRWSFTLSLLPSIAVVIYAEEALSIFGEEFAAGSGVLTLFVIGQLTNAAVGPSGYVLMMTDHQYLEMINQWIAGVSNVVLNYFFITNFGVIGAALATAGVMTVTNLIVVGQVWYTEGIVPYSFAFSKPVAAGVVAAGVMYGCTMFLSGFVLLVVGSAVGTVAYAGVIFATGIETEDREFFAELVSERTAD